MLILVDLNAERDLVLEPQCRTLEAANVSEFLAKLAGLGPVPFRSATVELNGVDMIDSSGVGALLQVHKRLGEGRGPVLLKNVSPAVVSVLELLRLHRVFEIEMEQLAGK